MPLAGYKKKLYKVVSSEMQGYYDEHHIGYEKIPLHNPLCERVFRDEEPLVLSPRNGTEYFISKKDPEPIQLQCRAGNDVNKIYWYVNNKFYKTSEAGGTCFFMPPEGRVKISCTDDKGRNKDVWIMVTFASP